MICVLHGAGIDQEDIELLKRSYESMLADDSQSYWLNDTHWVDHPPIDVPLPPKKKRRFDDLPLHKTGCARTEGIYKVDSKQKQKHKVSQDCCEYPWPEGEGGLGRFDSIHILYPHN